MRRIHLHRNAVLMKAWAFEPEKEQRIYPMLKRRVISVKTRHYKFIMYDADKEDVPNVLGEASYMFLGFQTLELGHQTLHGVIIFDYAKTKAQALNVIPNAIFTRVPQHGSIEEEVRRIMRLTDFDVTQQTEFREGEEALTAKPDMTFCFDAKYDPPGSIPAHMLLAIAQYHYDQEEKNDKNISIVF